MKKAYIIYNSLNKTSYFRDNIYKLIDYLSHNEYKIEIHSTTHANDLQEKIESLNNYDLVCISGGDGTIHECLAAINKLENKPKILYLPSGTINDFAHSLSIFPEIDYGIELLEKEQVRCLDLAKINDTIFTYVCAFGPFTATSYSVGHDKKSKFGALAYISDALSDVPKLITNCVKLKLIIDDDEVIEDDFIGGIIANSTSVAGFRHLFKESSLDDGLFEMIFISKSQVGKIKDFGTLITQGGITEKINSDKYIYRTFKKLQVISEDEVAWTLDGEEGPKGSLDIEVLEKNYEIYARKDV